MSFVHQYCHIRNRTLSSNGKTLFEDPGSGVDEFLDAAYDFIQPGYPKFYKMDRLGKLGILGSEMLLKNSGAITQYVPDKIALVLANAHSSTDTDEAYSNTISDIPSPSLFVYTLPNIVAGEICIRHKIKGENSFFIQPAFESGQICSYVDILLSSGTSHACIAGWIDIYEDREDLFLYLAEAGSGKQATEHTQESIQQLYQSIPWKN